MESFLWTYGSALLNVMLFLMNYHICQGTWEYMETAHSWQHLVAYMKWEIWGCLLIYEVIKDLYFIPEKYRIDLDKISHHQNLPKVGEPLISYRNDTPLNKKFRSVSKAGECGLEGHAIFYVLNQAKRAGRVWSIGRGAGRVCNDN